MIRMMIRHGVRSYSKWRRAYNAFDRERRGMGVKGHAVYRNVSSSNDITVSHDFASLAAARKFAGSRRLREVMKGAGVRTKPVIWYVRRTK